MHCRHCCASSYPSQAAHLLSGSGSDSYADGWFHCLHGSMEQTEGLGISGPTPDPDTRSSCKRPAALLVSGNRSHSAVHVLLTCSFQVFSTSTMKTFEKVASIEVPK